MTALAGAAHAAEPAADARDASKFDAHPDCMDRDRDAASGDCVIHDKGRPRGHLPAANPAPQAPAAPATLAPAAGGASAGTAGQGSAAAP